MTRVLRFKGDEAFLRGLEGTIVVVDEAASIPAKVFRRRPVDSMPFNNPTSPQARRAAQIVDVEKLERAGFQVLSSGKPWDVEAAAASELLSVRRKPPVEWSKVLLAELERAGHAGWRREYRFHPTRQWRFDCAHPALKLAIEVEGLKGTGKNKLGGHRGIKGFKDDIEKYGEAFALGWTLLRATTDDVRKGRVLRRLEARLARA